MRKYLLTAVIALLSMESFAQSVAVFNFATNPWGIETSTLGDEPEVGKIEDGKSLEQDGIKLSCQKINARYWNRIMDDKFKWYISNTVSFTAPEKVVITKIVFKCLPYQCDLAEVTQTGGVYQCDDDEKDNQYSWTGRAAMVMFKATNTSTFKSIEVTYAPEATTSIANLKTKKAQGNYIYTLQGKRLGTSDLLPSLPSGIYIVNGKKIVK